MAIPLIEILVKAYEKTLDFSDSVVKSFDDEKYAKSVTELYGREPTYDELDAAITVIVNDNNMATEKKLELLHAVGKQRDERRAKEFELKKKSAEIVNEGTRNKGEVAKKLALGVMTGGVSLLPDALRSVKVLGKEKNKNNGSDKE